MQLKEELLRRLRLWQGGIPQPPLKVIAYLTSRCNLDCLFCDVPESFRTGQVSPYGAGMTPSQWKALVREAIRFGVREWWFCGQGEPLFNPRLLRDLLRLIKAEQDSFCHVTTNGTLFTDSLVKEFVSLGLDNLNFSIDAPDSPTHDFLRGRRGAFEKAAGALRGFARVKKEMGTALPELSLTVVLNSRNYRMLPGMVRLASEIGVTRVSVNQLRVSPDNRERIKEHCLRVPPGATGEVKSIIERCVTLAAEQGITFALNGQSDLEVVEAEIRPDDTAEGFDTPHPRFEEAACFEPFYSMSINSDGSITYCPSRGPGDTDMPNVLTGGVEGAWFSPAMTSLRSRILHHDPPEFCHWCGVKSHRKAVEEAFQSDVETAGSE